MHEGVQISGIAMDSIGQIGNDFGTRGSLQLTVQEGAICRMPQGILHKVKKLLDFDSEGLCDEPQVIHGCIDHTALDPADHGHVKVAVDCELGLGHAFVQPYLFQMRAKGNKEGRFVELFNHIQKSVL